MAQIFIASLTRILMFFVAKILHQDSHYLEAPENILPTKRVGRILMLYHFFPSAIIAIIITVKILPLMSSHYATQLEANSGVIPLTFIFILPTIVILGGIVVEKILCRSNKQYAAFINSNNKFQKSQYWGVIEQRNDIKIKFPTPYPFANYSRIPDF